MIFSLKFSAFLNVLLFIIIQQTSAIPNDSQKTGISCSSKLTCPGIDSACYRNECLCGLGKIWDSINRKCEVKKCDSNLDCRWDFYNTKCDNSKRKCVCQKGASLEVATQSCIYSDLMTDSDVVMVVLLVLVFVGVLTVCCTHAQRRKRAEQRRQQVALLASARGGQIVVPTYQTGYGSVNSNQIYYQIPPPPYSV